MPQLSSDRHIAEIEASTAGLAEILAEHDQSLPIPTCPEWTLRQLVTHVGRAQRWAADDARRGLTRSFRSARYQTASCRMIAPRSQRGSGRRSADHRRCAGSGR